MNPHYKCLVGSHSFASGSFLWQWWPLRQDKKAPRGGSADDLSKGSDESTLSDALHAWAFDLFLYTQRWIDDILRPFRKRRWTWTFSTSVNSKLLRVCVVRSAINIIGKIKRLTIRIEIELCSVFVYPDHEKTTRIGGVHHFIRGRP